MRRFTRPQTPFYIATAFLVLTGSAQASTDAAWAAHDRAVVEQCQQASQFADAAPAGEPVLFDDEAGMTALLIQGHYSQDDGSDTGGSDNDGPDSAHDSEPQQTGVQENGAQNPLNGQAGQELCLFQRSSQKVYITDADKLAIGSDALPSTPVDAITDDTRTDDTQTGDAAPAAAGTDPSDNTP